jgi:hypothetical protein
VPDNIVLDGPEELMRLLMLPPGTRASDLELKAWRTVAERYGTGEALLRYAQLARSSGREDEAEHALSVACRFTFPKECKALRMSIAAR